MERTFRLAAIAVLVLTAGQLAVATFSSLPQFEGKAFGARLVYYPLLMLLVPAVWATCGTCAAASRSCRGTASRS